MDLLIQHAGETEAVRTLSSRISWYGKTMGHVKPLKEAIRVASTTAAMRAVLGTWLEQARADPESHPAGLLHN